MSIRIYRAWISDITTLSEATYMADEFRKQAVAHRDHVVNSLIKTCYAGDRTKFIHAIENDKVRRWYNPSLSMTFLPIPVLELSVQPSRASVILLDEEGDIYNYHHLMRQFELTYWTAPLPEWCYWDNTDRPEEVSAKEWKLRRSIVEEWVKYGNGSPSQIGATITIVGSSLHEAAQ